MGGSWKAKKEGLEQFADLSGMASEERQGVFEGEGGDIPMHTMCEKVITSQ